MKQLTHFLILSCACAALALTAVAGPVPISNSKEVMPTPVAPEPACNWTGFYLGFNGGYGWTDFDTDIEPVGTIAIADFSTQSLNSNANGAVFGGQVGFNYQWNWLVLGVEGDFDGAGMSGTDQLSVVSGRVPLNATDSFMVTDNINWLATVRARIGVAWNCNMFYVTGGGAWADFQRQATINAETAPGVFGSNASSDVSSNRGGFSAGGGWEYMIAKHWTVRAEYLFYHFDDTDDDFVTFDRSQVAGQSNANISTDNNDVHTVRLGLNFKF